MLWVRRACRRSRFASRTEYSCILLRTLHSARLSLAYFVEDVVLPVSTTAATTVSLQVSGQPSLYHSSRHQLRRTCDLSRFTGQVPVTYRFAALCSGPKLKPQSTL